ncbi:hypothetical protein [Natronorubrum bangense]|nr:hypothetical protein [Natronorubrum bangense]
MTDQPVRITLTDELDDAPSTAPCTLCWQLFAADVGRTEAGVE